MSPAAIRAFPLVFVVLWSTGFIGARLGLPHVEPLTFLLIRYSAVLVLMTLVALVTRAPWPPTWGDWLHMGVAGILLHGVYLGGVFVAISMGLPAGVASLIVGLQPLLTAVGAGWWLGEVIRKQQWLGLLIGLAGVALVVAGKVGTGFGLIALLPVSLALLGITGGTLYQKRYCRALDWRTGSVAQFVPAALLTLVAAAWTEQFRVEWAGELLFAIGWLVLVLSVGAVSLLNWLIRQSSAVNVASLFYLVPVCTALLAWVLFGEVFSGLAMVGMGMTVGGVYLARNGDRS